MTSNWYVLAVQPRKESYVETQLRAIGITAACPCYRRTVRHSRRVKTAAYPLFPGYLFVQFNEGAHSWRLINSLQGAIGLVKFQNRPSPLNTEFVQDYISGLPSDGIVQLKTQLKLGDRVQAIGGPFDRLVGAVVGMPEKDRVKILMDALHRKMEVTLPRTNVTVSA